jgi:hypothetical protein
MDELGSHAKTDFLDIVLEALHDRGHKLRRTHAGLEAWPLRPPLRVELRVNGRRYDLEDLDADG